MFFKSKSKVLSRIISLSNPFSARGSVEVLKRKFLGAKRRATKVRVLRATRLASNRALASMKKSALSMREKVEFRDVARVYEDASNWMRRRL